MEGRISGIIIIVFFLFFFFLSCLLFFCVHKAGRGMTAPTELLVPIFAPPAGRSGLSRILRGHGFLAKQQEKDCQQYFCRCLGLHVWYLLLFTITEAYGAIPCHLLSLIRARRMRVWKHCTGLTLLFLESRVMPSTMEENSSAIMRKSVLSK